MTGVWPEGFVFTVPYPFVWEKTSVPGTDPEGPYSVEIMTWRPGTILVNREMPKNANPYEWCPDDDPKEVAHGTGAQIITIASVHKPGRFPTRVFYSRRWRDPNGKEFGKGGLRIKTLGAFKRLVSGYRCEFEVIELATAASDEVEEPVRSAEGAEPQP
jgi:hypothetical protein